MQLRCESLDLLRLVGYRTSYTPLDLFSSFLPFAPKRCRRPFLMKQSPLNPRPFYADLESMNQPTAAAAELLAVLVDRHPVAGLEYRILHSIEVSKPKSGRSDSRIRPPRSAAK